MASHWVIGLAPRKRSLRRCNPKHVFRPRLDVNRVGALLALERDVAYIAGKTVVPVLDLRIINVVAGALFIDPNQEIPNLTPVDNTQQFSGVKSPNPDTPSCTLTR
jgi:hypothetical protein